MTSTVPSRPLVSVPPKTYWAVAPNVSGASASSRGAQHGANRLGSAPHLRGDHVEARRVERWVRHRQEEGGHHEQRNRDEQRSGDDGRDEDRDHGEDREGGHDDAGVDSSAFEHRVGDPPAGDHSHDSADSTERHDSERAALAQSVVTLGELDPERPDTGEHVVAQRRRHDQHDVRADAQDVLEDLPQGEPSGIGPYDRVLIGGDARLRDHGPGQVQRRVDLGGRGDRGGRERRAPARPVQARPDSIGGLTQHPELPDRHPARSASRRLGQALEQPADAEGARAHEREREAPRHEHRGAPCDHHADAGSHELTTQQEAEHLTALGGGEPIAHERRDSRIGDRRGGTEEHSAHQEHRVGGRECLHHHDDTPAHDDHAEQVHPPRSIDEHPERDGDDDGDDAGDGQQQPDLSRADRERPLEIGRRRADHALVRAVQGQDGPERRDHPEPSRPPRHPFDPLDPHLSPSASSMTIPYPRRKD